MRGHHDLTAQHLENQFRACKHLGICRAVSGKAQQRERKEMLVVLKSGRGQGG